MVQFRVSETPPVRKERRVRRWTRLSSGPRTNKQTTLGRAGPSSQPESRGTGERTGRGTPACGDPRQSRALCLQGKAEGPVTRANPPVIAVSGYFRQALTGVGKINIGPESFVD